MLFILNDQLLVFAQNFFNFGIVDTLGAAVVELPYKNSNMSMLVFLPLNCSQYYSFNYQFGAFNFSSLHDVMFKRQVNLKIPEFSIEFEMKNMKTELTKVRKSCCFFLIRYELH